MKYLLFYILLQKGDGDQFQTLAFRLPAKHAVLRQVLTEDALHQLPDGHARGQGGAKSKGPVQGAGDRVVGRPAQGAVLHDQQRPADERARAEGDLDRHVHLFRPVAQKEPAHRGRQTQHPDEGFLRDPPAHVVFQDAQLLALRHIAGFDQNKAVHEGDILTQLLRSEASCRERV